MVTQRGQFLHLNSYFQPRISLVEEEGEGQSIKLQPWDKIEQKNCIRLMDKVQESQAMTDAIRPRVGSSTVPMPKRKLQTLKHAEMDGSSAIAMKNDRNVYWSLKNNIFGSETADNIICKILLGKR